MNQTAKTTARLKEEETARFLEIQAVFAVEYYSEKDVETLVAHLSEPEKILLAKATDSFLLLPPAMASRRAENDRRVALVVAIIQSAGREAEIAMSLPKKPIFTV